MMSESTGNDCISVLPKFLSAFATCLVICLAVSPFVSSLSFAHTKISPENLILRNMGDGIKDPNGPCGGTAPSSEGPRTALKAGEDYEITWFETIDHPSKYRLAFSKDETDTFDTILMDLDDFNDDSKDPKDLAAGEKQDIDGAVDRNNPRRYTYTIKVPENLCDRCSIQLIQRMFDRDPPTNYYSCADIKVVPAGSSTDEPEVNPSPDIPEPPTGLKLKVYK